MRESCELVERQECSAQHKESQDRDEMRDSGGVYLLYCTTPETHHPLLLFFEIPVFVLQWQCSYLVKVEKCVAVHRPYVELPYTRATNPIQC